MIKSALLIITFCLLSSCATVFNSTHKRVDVITSRPSTLICLNNNDTLRGTTFSTWVKRGDKHLNMVVISDTNRVSIVARRKLSFAYFANFLFNPYGIPGFIIDSYSPRRFTFPRYFGVDFEKETPEITKRRKTDPSWMAYRNYLKISPLKIFAYANPGLEIGYERSIGKRFGIQVEAAALAPPLTVAANYAYAGFGAGIEPRFYFCQRFRYRWFTGIQASWSYVRYSNTFDYITPGRPAEATQFFYVNTRVDRSISHVAPKIGFQYARGHFIAEISIGAGLKYRNVSHLDKLEGTEYFYYQHANAYTVLHSEGNGFQVGTPGTFMLGWRF